MELRDARPGDGPEIGRIHAASWRAAYAGILPAVYLERLDAGRLGRTWLLRIEKRSVGHVWVA